MKRLLDYGYALMKSGLFYGTLKVTSLCKMSFIIGSHFAFFSASNILYPVGGLCLGTTGTLLWLIISSIAHVLAGAPLYLYLIHGIPGFCAALYMSSSHWLIRLIVPLLCMLLFIAHPVGFQAAPYTLYWLIPVVFYFINKKSLFTQALGATFVAHAVGSVSWLYLVPMPVAYWWSLIPLVALERISFAIGAVLAYYGYVYGAHMVKMVTMKRQLMCSFVKNGNNV